MSIHPLAKLFRYLEGGASRGALAKKSEKLVPRGGRLQDWRKFPGIGTDGTSCAFAVQLHSPTDGRLRAGPAHNIPDRSFFRPVQESLVWYRGLHMPGHPGHNLNTRRAISAYLYETCTVAPCSSATEFQFAATTTSLPRQKVDNTPTKSNIENPGIPIYAPPRHVGSPPHVSLQCRPTIFGHNSLILGSILAASFF